MAKNKYIVGGEKSLNDASAAIRGVYANYPAMIPRFGHRPANEDGRYEVARFYTPFPNKKTRDAFVKRVKSYSSLAAPLSEAFAITSEAKDNIGIGYIDFLLTSVNVNFQEKSQIESVLSDNYVLYVYGQQPPTMMISGILINTYQDDWAAAFQILYSSILRGSRQADLKIPIYLRYGNHTVAASVLSFTQSIQSTNQEMVSFNMNLVVKKFSTDRIEGAVPTAVGVYASEIKSSADEDKGSDVVMKGVK